MNATVAALMDRVGRILVLFFSLINTISAAYASSVPPNDHGPESEVVVKATVSINDSHNGAIEEKSRNSDMGTLDLVIGNDTTYVVRKHESIKAVSAKTGVSWQVIARENKLDPKKKLQPGKVLHINKKRIVPKIISDGIVINIPDRTLYYFKGGKFYMSYPVALGMAKSDKFSWHTPTGKFIITSKQKDPAWYVPHSLQQEMKAHGKSAATVVPPGPANPLGRYALRTSFDSILIHGTTAPDSIYSFSSHGCVRMLPRDIESIYNSVRVKTEGEIIYVPVKVAVSEEGRVFLEAHQDAYKMVPDLESATKKLLEEKNVVDRVDWEKVRGLLKNGNGKVEDITL